RHESSRPRLFSLNPGVLLSNSQSANTYRSKILNFKFQFSLFMSHNREAIFFAKRAVEIEAYTEFSLDFFATNVKSSNC
uniref:Uncharacterized protein n=1 Tax=Ciona savignyi TaxID=51511 RepID=H2YSE8_CIOSA